ncbi:5-hydroxyisourate hydrolase [Thalassocella blandensis]|nr:5-hydroxyisourate hydrolase [Thalassocella blandensis]
MTKAPITTHILNLSTGKPAAEVSVALYSPTAPHPVATGKTDKDGRIMHWDSDIELEDGVWHLEFATEQWFAANEQTCFFANVRLSFNVSASELHYHVPLLLNAFGYSTYRGS